MSRLRNRELALLAAVAIAVPALGWIIGRDLQRSAESASQLYARLAHGIDLIEELEFSTQEARRIILYALHTSDANRQLHYAEQSRAADRQVQRLLDSTPSVVKQPEMVSRLEAIRLAWQRYILVRDDVIGLILEGSLADGVALDEGKGTVSFTQVREEIDNLEKALEADAAFQVAEARAGAARATLRLMLLVLSALVAAAIGIYLVDRRAALEGVLRSEAHKGSILQAVPNPVIGPDAAGRIIELNEAAERAFGFARSEALGRPIESLILPERARGLLPSLVPREATAVPGVARRIETFGKRRDGNEFPMELVEVTHLAGRDQVWTLHLTDLTERRRIEALLRGAKEAAEGADRAKSDFLATMSHELRTPLHAVIGGVDLLGASDASPSTRELLRLLKSSASALLGLVDDVLDYTRIESGMVVLNPTRFSLGTCIEDALDPVTEHAARKQIDLGYVIDPDIPDLVADQSRVRQVLLNLLSNAVKFTDTGEISVHASAVPIDDKTLSVTVRVHDTGTGIPEAWQHDVFRRFSQVDATTTRQHGGAGLGLAIAHRLSRCLGGSLSVESRVGEGSTFTFVFAARRGLGTDADDGSLAHTEVFTLLGSGIVSRQVQSLLRRWGVRTAIGHLGDVAWSDPRPPRFDAVVVDADVLDNQGNEGVLRRWALRELPPAPVIVVTRRLGSKAVLAFAPEAQAVSKPVRAGVLRDALGRAAGIPAAPPTLAGTADLEKAGKTASRAILLVEDNEANRRVTQLMLEELGLAPDVATSGVEAVERAKGRSYDVILMDVQMPGIDGVETTRRIRAEAGTNRPVIVGLTANVMAGEAARCRAAGMDDCLSKPVGLKRLAEALAMLDGSVS